MADTNSEYLGTGRRKTAVARIRLTEGSGQVKINGKAASDFFSHENFSRSALLPFTTIEAKDKFDVVAKVQGGGDSGQAGALALGIARALLKFDSELRIQLKQAGHLTRDPKKKQLRNSK